MDSVKSGPTLVFYREFGGEKMKQVDVSNFLSKSSSPTEKLIESSEKAIFNSLHEAIITFDKDGKILAWNKAATDIFDYDATEIIGKNIGLLVPTTTWKSYVQAVQVSDQGILEHLSRAHELDGYRKFGGSFPMEISLSHWVSNGEPSFSLIARDVTERHRFEMQIEEQMEFQEALLEAQSDLGEGLAVFDLSTRHYIFVNPAYCAIFGYSEEELMAMDDPWSLVPEEARELLQRRIWSRQKAAIDNDHFETIVRNKSGEIVYINVALKDIETGHGRSSLVIVRDISEQRCLQEALQLSESQNRLIMENARDVILTTDTFGRITFLSPSFDGALGFKAKDWLGKEFGPLVHHEDHARVMKYFEMVMYGKTTPHFEYRVATSSGRYLDVEINAGPLIKEGRVVGLLAIARSIVDRKKAEIELSNQKQRFQALSEATTEGVCITHDGIIIEANEQFARIFGYTMQEVIGQTPNAVTAPEDQELVRKMRDKKSTESYVFTGLRKDGSKLKLQVTGRDYTYLGKQVRLTAMHPLTEQDTL